MTVRRALLALLALVVICLVVGGVLVARDPGVLLQTAAAYERGKADLVERTWAWSGHEIVALEGGGDGVPVVMVHGFAADKDNWTRFAVFLNDAGHRLLAPDLPGHGESSRLPEHAYDIPAQVDFLAAYLDDRGVSAAHLVGNSMGGHVVGAFAARFPDRVLSLGLFNAAGVTAPQPSERERIMTETGTNPLLVESVEDFDRLLGFVFVESPSLPGFLKDWFAERAATNRAFNDRIYADLKSGRLVPMEPRLASLTMPALVLWGDTDRVLHPSGADVFMAGLPNATKVVMEACGHAPMIERPGETAEHYLAFLAASTKAQRQ